MEQNGEKNFQWSYENWSRPSEIEECNFKNLNDDCIIKRKKQQDSSIDIWCFMSHYRLGNLPLFEVKLNFHKNIDIFVNN